MVIFHSKMLVHQRVNTNQPQLGVVLNNPQLLKNTACFLFLPYRNQRWFAGQSPKKSLMIVPSSDRHKKLVDFPAASWVCLKIGYIPNYSHLIGIMIINHWVQGYTTFSDTPSYVLAPKKKQQNTPINILPAGPRKPHWYHLSSRGTRRCGGWFFFGQMDDAWYHLCCVDVKSSELQHTKHEWNSSRIIAAVNKSKKHTCTQGNFNRASCKGIAMTYMRHPWFM